MTLKLPFADTVQGLENKRRNLNLFFKEFNEKKLQVQF